MFDLPVTTPGERKAATRFRDFLLDEGFSMSQFSVYFRFCGDRSRIDFFINRIKSAIPNKGDVSILCFTDHQFGDIINIKHKKEKKIAEKPEQLVLF